MVDWHNPQTIAAELFAYVKLLHVVAGLYFWEYFTNLHYEWEFIKRKRPYRWTIWLYSVTRFCALMNIILGLVAFNTQRPLNCELWLLFEFIFAYVAFALAAFLIIIRIVAIWNRDRYVSLLAISIWLVNIAFLLRSTAKADSKWDDGSKGCTIVNSKDSRINVTVTLVSDLLCLFIMIIGLRRQRDHALGRMLFNQGLIWVVLATVSEMPPTIFLWLDLNDAMNIMFQTPSLLAMTIGATRMYRSLLDFAHYDVPMSLPIIAGAGPSLNFATVGSTGVSSTTAADELSRVPSTTFVPVGNSVAESATTRRKPLEV